jgi:hypothetical protein
VTSRLLLSRLKRGDPVRGLLPGVGEPRDFLFQGRQFANEPIDLLGRCLAPGIREIGRSAGRASARPMTDREPDGGIPTFAAFFAGCVTDSVIDTTASEALPGIAGPESRL